MKQTYTLLAKYYDLIFSSKNYGKEVEFIRKTVKAKYPRANSLLDVGCGTGNHLNLLKNDFRILWGVDLNPKIIRIAKSKSSKINYLVGEMKNFKLNQKFDVIICLYAVFNYNLNSEDAKQTLINFKKHLNSNGLVIIALYTPQNTQEVVALNLGKNETVEVAKIDQYKFDPSTKMETSDYLVLVKTSAGLDFTVEKGHQFRIFDATEFSDLCQDVGFAQIRYYNDFQDKPITKQTENPIAVIQ